MNVCPDCAALTSADCGKHGPKVAITDWQTIERSYVVARLHPDEKAQLDRIEAALARLERRLTTSISNPVVPSPNTLGFHFEMPPTPDRCPSCGARFIFGMPGPLWRTCLCEVVLHMPLYVEDSGA